MSQKKAKWWVDTLWHLFQVPFVIVRSGDCARPSINHNCSQDFPPVQSLAQGDDQLNPPRVITFYTSLVIIDTIEDPMIRQEGDNLSVLMNQRGRNRYYVLSVNPLEMTPEITELWQRAYNRQHQLFPLNILKPD